MSSPDPKLVERLWGRAPSVIEPAASGANGIVYHVRAGDDEAALKRYPRRPGDDRDRLGTETGAVRFMVTHGLDSVADVIGASAADGVALFEWLPGGPVDAAAPSDIEAALDFAAAVAGLSDRPGADRFGPASEACPAPGAIVSQLAERRRVLGGTAERDAEVAGLLARHDSAVSTVTRDIAAAYDATGWAFDSPLGRGQQRLIPADFGFHNAIREPGGRLRFFDFEYFGWDDPVKLVADLILHPACPLDPAGKELMRAGATKRFSKDAEFERRLETLLPAFALRWALIVLNPLRPAQYETGAQADGWDALKTDRLQKAHNYIDLSETLLRTP